MKTIKKAFGTLWNYYAQNAVTAIARLLQNGSKQPMYCLAPGISAQYLYSRCS